MATQQGFHNIYRPTNFEETVGNEAAVTQLKGIIKKGKFPSAILFTGPAGVGKTTMARAFVNEVNGTECNFVVNCTETNFGEARSIDDIRSLMQIAKLRPAQGAIRRFIICDESHGILGSPVAANSFLKPLEEPVSTTTFLLCSMDSDKFATSSVGRAILSRCNNVQLKQPSEDDMRKQALRIMRAEGMKEYLSKETLPAVIQASSNSMRVLANNLEALANFHAGLGEGRELTAEDVNEAVNMAGTNDDVIAFRFMLAIYARKYVAAHKELLDIGDAFGFINKTLWLNWFCLSNAVLKGARHPKVWGSTQGWNLLKESQKLFEGEGLSREATISIMSETQAALTSLKMGAGAFAVDEKMALASMSWDLIQRLKLKLKG